MLKILASTCRWEAEGLKEKENNMKLSQSPKESPQAAGRKTRVSSTCIVCLSCQKPRFISAVKYIIGTDSCPGCLAIDDALQATIKSFRQFFA